jgi:hypothetical protein
MTAQGKMNAANLAKLVAAGTPVRVLLVMEDAERLVAAGVTRDPGLVPATRKTGVDTLALLETETRMAQGFRRPTRQYRFRTSAGWTLWLSPTQTLILAPEDGPAVKRAHAEALEEDARVNEVLRLADEIQAERDQVAHENQIPSVFPDAPSVRTYADGSQEYGPYSGTAVGAVHAFREPEETRTAVIRSGPLAGAVVRNLPARETPEDQRPAPGKPHALSDVPAKMPPILSPAERAEQATSGVGDLALYQLLHLLDTGTVFELHPDGVWRDRDGASGLLDPTVLRNTIEAAKRHGLVRQMGGQGRYVANPTLVPAPVHQAVTTPGRTRPICLASGHLAGPHRIRLSHRSEQVTCPRCIDYMAELKREAAALAERIEARGIRVDAVVTIHRGTQQWTVVEIAEDMVRVAPNLSEEERASEAAGGKVRDLQWVSWDLLHVVPAGK